MATFNVFDWAVTTSMSTGDVTTFLVQFVAVAVATALLYWVFQPVNLVRDMCDVGYSQQIKTELYGRSRRQVANEARRMKKTGDLPPVYPNGWFAVLESSELKAEGVRSINVLGENLVVFRNSEGKARVLDAYCPHLGANLGIGGRVVGDCIECPFHGWQFDGQDGKCTRVPYAEKTPNFAGVRSWNVKEVNGFVFLWYHAEKEEPNWDIPAIDEIESNAWVYRGRTEHRINCHVQEIPENGADVAHLDHLHGPSMLYGSDLHITNYYGTRDDSGEKRAPCAEKIDNAFKLTPFIQHHWTVNWQPADAPDNHLATSYLRHDLRLFNKFPLIIMHVQAKQIGPGVVHLTIDTSLGPCVLVQTVTPTEPMMQRVINRFYTASSVIAPYAKLILWGEILMFERDVMVWNHKTYAGRPVLVAEDRTISKHRRWFQQFYTENSPRFQFQKDTLDW